MSWQSPARQPKNPTPRWFFSIESRDRQELLRLERGFRLSVQGILYPHLPVVVCSLFSPFPGRNQNRGNLPHDPTTLFPVFIRASAGSEAGNHPDAKVFAAIAAFN